MTSAPPRVGDEDGPDTPGPSHATAESLVGALDVVLFHTIEGRIVWVSPSVHDFLGYRPEDVIGLAAADMWHPDDRAAGAALRDDALERRMTERVMRVQAADGTFQSVEVVLRPQIEPDGRNGSVGLVRPVADDVDARHPIDAFRIMAEHATDLLVLIDATGSTVWVSQAVSDALGWTREELVGSHLADLMHPEDRAALAELRLSFYDETRSPGAKAPSLARLRTRDGDYRWMSARGTQILEDDGTLVAVVAGLSDVDELVRLRMRAEETAEKLRATRDGLLDPYIVIEAIRDDARRIIDFRFIEANRAAADYFGVDRDALVGSTMTECFPDPNGAALLRRYAAIVDRDGPIVLNDVPIVGAVSGVTGYYDVRASRQDHLATITWREVSGRHEALAALARSEALMRAVLDSSPDPTVQFDRDLRISYSNRLADELLQRRPEDLIGLGFGDLGFPDQIVEDYELRLREVFRTGKPIVEERQPHNTRFGQAREHRYIPMLAADGSVDHVLVITRDITERRAVEALLIERATRDPLTGLANRAALADEIDRAVQAGQRSHGATAVLMVDLDNFKHVNDSLGHAVGDRLLVAAAERLSALARGGEMVARFGGDEFVLVLRDLDEPTDAVRTAERIVEAFRVPIEVDGTDIYTTASVGIAVAGDGVTADDLIREADTALYVSKDEGRDRIAIFNAELRAIVSERLTIEAQLRPALERGELEVWYQPEVDMLSGRVTAVEALLRWNHPERGLLTAERFIDVAEETGLVLEIGAWVLRQACTQTARWNRSNADRPIVVRVNLSARQLMEGDVLAAIDLALDESHLSPRLLCVEITETALLRQSPRVVDHLQQIRHRGVQLALDDFGTGYASLSYLREFPVDVLKIDRSFVSHIIENDFDARLVGGIIALAEALEVRITAEGVETVEQADLLIELGCDRAQGYLYSRAVPAESIDAMLG